MPDAEHELFIVWTNTFPSDDAVGAAKATATFDDARVHQYHDPGRAIGRAFAPLVDMPTMRGVAEAMGADVDVMKGRFRDSYLHGEAALFDSMFFYPPGVEWTGEAPPAHSGWVTQLDPTTFLLEADRFFWGEEMGNEMARLMRGVSGGVNEPIQATRVWSGAPHNAFGDLVRFGDRYFATCREGESHVGDNGKVRIVASDDGATWSPIALLEEEGIDLRDPKLTVTPSGELMMTCGGVDYSAGLVERHTRAALSPDGETWSAIRRVEGIPTSNWFFRTAWHDSAGWCMPNLWDQDPETGKIDGDTRRIALFRTTDGLRYERIGEDLPLPAGACEASLAFEPDGTMLAVLRDAYDAKHAWLVRAAAPYREFEVTEITHGLGGPHLVRLNDGTLLVATREWPHDRDDGVEDYATVILRLNLDGTWTRAAMLPSGGDTSYPAIVPGEDEVLVQYYSSHEPEHGTAIYVARVPLSRLTN